MQWFANAMRHLVRNLENALIPSDCIEDGNKMCQKLSVLTFGNVSIYRRTFSTRIVAGELTTDSLRFGPTTGGSSRGLLDADVAMANAAAAVDVLLLLMSFEQQN